MVCCYSTKLLLYRYVTMWQTGNTHTHTQPIRHASRYTQVIQNPKPTHNHTEIIHITAETLYLHLQTGRHLCTFRWHSDMKINPDRTLRIVSIIKLIRRDAFYRAFIAPFSTILITTKRFPNDLTSGQIAQSDWATAAFWIDGLWVNISTWRPDWGHLRWADFFTLNKATGFDFVFLCDPEGQIYQKRIPLTGRLSRVGEGGEVKCW